jgi:pSer/pThr/pTyr-binding forkhead associated (FHA) protein
MAFKLSIEQGKGRGKAFDFDAEQITIGRTEENDVVLYEQGVSRRHARISRSEGRYYVEDLESANGTLLNGNKIQKEELNDGDRIGIGEVVFRYGAEEQASAGEGSTRIVSISKEDRAKPRPKTTASPTTQNRALPAGTPRPDALGGALDRRYVVIFVAVALILAIAWAALNGPHTKVTDRQQCPSTLDLADVKGLVFGTSSESVCTPAGNEIRFGFNSAPRTKYIFSYSAFYTDTGEVEVLLNDKHLRQSPLSSTRRSKRDEVVIDESAIKSGPNIITFKSKKSGEWGIERLDLIPVPIDQASREQGGQHLSQGVDLYQQKNVAASNLYAAFVELRQARKYLEGLPDPKPPEYLEAKEQAIKVEEELDQLCSQRMWGAKRFQTYKKFEAAADQYKYLVAAFPGDEHPCRAEALAQLTPQQRSAFQKSTQ